MKRVIYFWFCYKDDFEELQKSIEICKLSVPKNVDPIFVVADDAFNPISFSNRNLLSDDIKYLQTTWNRGGNLRGGVHLQNATRLYNELCRDYQADYLMKIDPDISVIKQDFLEKCIEADAIAYMGICLDSPQYLFGGAYLLKSSILPSLAQDCWDFVGHFTCYEDYEIGVRVMRLFGTDRIMKSRLFHDNEFINTQIGQIDQATIMNWSVIHTAYNRGFMRDDKKEQALRIEVMDFIISELQKKNEIKNEVINAKIS